MKSIRLISLLIFSEVVHSSRWSLKVPWKVSAVNGSCAEIPCTFDYPAYGRSPQGMWLKGGPKPSTSGVSIICDSRNSDNVPLNYRGRAQFTGEFEKKQCSLQLKDIRKIDEGVYYFKLEIINAQNKREGYSTESKVTLSILDKPWISVSGELIAGTPANLTCSVTHSCPSANLELMWTHDNVVPPFLPEIKTSKGHDNSFDDSQKVSSTFNFSPSLDHHAKKMGCKLIVDGVTATDEETLTLDVKNGPQKTGINSSIAAVEGSSLLLYCTARGTIPSNLTLVRNGEEIGKSSTGELKHIFHNISFEYNGEYWCVADNNLGKANSSSQISVQYKPTVVSGPTCTSSESGVHCTCSVRANPPTNITWGINGRNITVNSSDINILSSDLNSYLEQSSLTLTHPTGTGHLISCFGVNVHGVTVGKYQLQTEGTFPWEIVISVLAAAAVILLILIVVMVHRKKTRATTGVPLTNHDSRQDKYGKTGVRGTPSNESAQSEEVLYAAVSVSKVRKQERYLQNEESCEYAAIKCN